VLVELIRGSEMATDVRVVYIEDNFWNRKVVEMLIVHLLDGAQFHIFNDSTDLIGQLELLAWHPNVILVDIHMHPFNGYEVLQMLRQHGKYKNTKIIAVTAALTQDDTRRIQDAGFDGVIAKPIDVNTFPRIIDQVLRGEEAWNEG
jgi:CheY-like chemotaxis protein